MILEREESSAGCANGNPLDVYPEQYKGASRIGVNWKGMVEYVDVDDYTVYELIYGVRRDTIDELHVHNMLGPTPLKHVKESVMRWNRWWIVEIDRM